MDALFLFRHSQFADIEIRYALRGIARHAPSIRKVWVFGDRPEFLSGDRDLIEHLPHEGLARLGGYQTPITNFFLMFWVSSHIPDLSQDILWFCDDFILLNDFSPEEARRDRYVEDLSDVKTRGRGKWQDSLGRTYDFLKERGYTGYNFETHLPTYFTRQPAGGCLLWNVHVPDGTRKADSTLTVMNTPCVSPKRGVSSATS